MHACARARRVFLPWCGPKEAAGWPMGEYTLLGTCLLFVTVWEIDGMVDVALDLDIYGQYAMYGRE